MTLPARLQDLPPRLTAPSAERLRAIARLWRKEHPHVGAGGYVTIFGDEATGWASVLDKPQDFVAGNHAVPADGSAIFRSTGGDQERGADAWTEVEIVEAEKRFPRRGKTRGAGGRP